MTLMRLPLATWGLFFTSVLNVLWVPVVAVALFQVFLDRALGANFFPNYALDHHAYLNVGYAVICLSNVAMLHYAYTLRGLEAPQAVYHHGRDLWNVVRRL